MTNTQHITQLSQIPEPYFALNFVKSEKLRLCTSKPTGKLSSLVTFVSDSGSCRFQFSMLPQQAIELASVLVDMALTAEEFDIQDTMQAEADAEQAAA
jgi:hypothetical protein